MPRHRPTAQRRTQARQQDADLAVPMRIGIAQSMRIGARLQVGAARAYRRGENVLEFVGRTLDKLYPLILRGMVFARLKGIERGRESLPARADLALAGETYKRATDALRKRLMVPVSVLEQIEEQFGAHAIRVTMAYGAAVERRVQETLLEVQRQGLHVKDGVAKLGKAFAKEGITPEQPFALEAIYRTQTALAYGAGKQDVEASPEVQEILWGYEYVTVGDDRVRDRHVALDGTRLPKDHEFWSRNYPPNGYACRCQVIAIYDKEPVVEPPDEVEVNGKKVEPGADPGFAYSPRQVFGAIPLAT